MEKIFIPIYRFFRRHRAVMWTLMTVSFAVFVFFGVQLKYEENILKLLPQTKASQSSYIAFGNLRVKDKLFIQIAPKGLRAADVLSAEAAAGDALHGDDSYGAENDELAAGGVPDVETMCLYCDELMDSIILSDNEGLIANALYRLDDDLAVNGIDYVLSTLPTFVSDECYQAFDSLLTFENIRAQMAVNAGLIENDEDGNLSMMVSYDPAALRKGMIGEGLALKNGLGGFSVQDNHFFSPDHKVVMAFVSPDFSSMDSKAGIELVSRIEKQADRFTKAHPEVEVFIHGSPVMSANNSRRIKADLVLTVCLSLLIICCLIAYCFKNKNSLLFLLLPVVYGTFFALACVYWIKGGMSLMAIGIGAVVLGVALSYCLHVVTHYKYVSDPEQVLRDQSTPVFLGCLTTVGAFVGLLFTSSELLRDFGIFASFAMIGTTFFSLAFLPQFFKPENNRRSEKAFSLLRKINSYPLDSNRWVLGAVIVITVVCVCLPAPKFDRELKHINYVSPKVKEALALYNAENNRGYASQYYATSHFDLDSALLYNRAVTGVLDSLQRESVVKQYSKAGALFIPTEEQQRRIDGWSAYWHSAAPGHSHARLDEARHDISRAAAEYGLSPRFFEPFYNLCDAVYEPSSLYDSGVLPEGLLCNFIEQAADGSYVVLTSALMPEEMKMEVNKAVDRQAHSLVIDPFYYTGDMVEIIHSDFNTILWVSMVFVFIVLLVSFRCLGLSIVAFLPMTLGWFIVQGVMWTFGLEFNLINIIIASFIFGIGVDYSIFVMQGLLAGASGSDTRLLTYHKSAIFLSAVILITVTGSLLFARHPAIRSIGISSVVGMSASIILAYTLEPFLFRELMKIPYYRKRYCKENQ